MKIPIHFFSLAGTLFGVSFLIWPFSILGINSQIIGVFIALLFIIKTTGFKVTRDNELIILLLLTPIYLICIIHIIISEKNSLPGMFIYLTYLVKIPIFYFLTLYLIKSFGKLNINPEKCFLYFSFCSAPFIFFIYIQLLFPSLNQILISYLQDTRVTNTIEYNMSGHDWRFLGWNGFLYASHAVGLGFSAIFLLIARKKIVENTGSKIIFFSVLCEMSCIIFSLFSGRTAIPLVLLYFIMYFYYEKGVVKKILFAIITLFATISILYIFSSIDGGQSIISWLIEPFTTSIKYGQLKSHSVDELNSTYHLFLQSLNEHYFIRENILFGLGVFSKMNGDYSFFNLQGSDSGLLRSIYAIGYIGTALFILFWITLTIRAIILNIKFNVNKNWSWVLIILVCYSSAFFYKSEWLYQNYFLFYFFLIYHSMIKRAKK